MRGRHRLSSLLLRCRRAVVIVGVFAGVMSAPMRKCGIVTLGSGLRRNDGLQSCSLSVGLSVALGVGDLGQGLAVLDTLVSVVAVETVAERQNGDHLERVRDSK